TIPDVLTPIFDLLFKGLDLCGVLGRAFAVFCRDLGNPTNVVLKGLHARGVSGRDLALLGRVTKRIPDLPARGCSDQEGDTRCDSRELEAKHARCPRRCWGLP